MTSASRKLAPWVFQRIEVLLDLLGGGLHEFEPPLAEQLSIPEEADNHGNDSGYQYRQQIDFMHGHVLLESWQMSKDYQGSIDDGASAWASLPR